MNRYLCLVIFLLLPFSVNSVEQSIKIYTENYPPYNMYNKDKTYIIGQSTEIVKKIFQQAGIEYSLALVPWARALKSAKERQNTAIYSMARVPDREDYFYWIGPIVVNKWIFMSREADKIIINSLADIEKLRIGTYRSDISYDFLLNQGFSPSVTSFDHQNAGKLKLNRIDLWSTGLLLGPQLSAEAKIDGLSVVKTSLGEPFVFIKTGMYLGINKSTSYSVYQKLEQAFQTIAAENTPP